MQKNKYVGFVSDGHFLKCVKHVCEGYFEAREEVKIEVLKDNGLDPFKTVFDIANRGIDFDTWLKIEEGRQLDKTLNNRIGEFHQMLLGGVNGWKDLGVGDESKLDIIKEDNTIAMEVKNKFNTVNADSLSKVRDKIKQFVQKNPNSKAYWSYIIEKDNSSGEKVWVYKGDKNPKLMKAWGSKVYEIVTGDSKALEKTWKSLPLAIQDLVGKKIAEKDMKKLISSFSSALN